MTTTLESSVLVSKDVHFEKVAGEAAILNLKSGKYYGLDELGTRMWTLLAEHGHVALAYETLLEEYDVSEAQLKQDLLGLIDDMVTHGLVQVVEA